VLCGGKLEPARVATESVNRREACRSNIFFLLSMQPVRERPDCRDFTIARKSRALRGLSLICGQLSSRCRAVAGECPGSSACQHQGVSVKIGVNDAPGHSGNLRNMGLGQTHRTEIAPNWGMVRNGAGLEFIQVLCAREIIDAPKV